MGILEIAAIAVGLSADAFAVSISNVLCYRDMAKRWLLFIPLAFGLFQGIMPLLGYYFGSLFKDVFDAYGGIVTLLILGFIGGKMVYDGYRSYREDNHSNLECTSSACDAGQAETPAAVSVGTEAPTAASETVTDKSCSTVAKLTLGVLLAQAIATSIDAFAVGVSYSVQSVNIFLAASLTALTTFLLSGVALFVGKRFGHLLGDRAEILGGIVLILIGIKALF